MKSTILQQRMQKYIEQGYSLYEFSSGQATFTNKSNSGRIILEGEKKIPNAEWAIVVGAKRHYRSEGTKNAVMFKLLSQTGTKK